MSDASVEIRRHPLTCADQGHGGGSSMSESVAEDDANPAPGPATYGTYPGYDATRMTPSVPRGLSRIAPEAPQNTLDEVANRHDNVITARTLRRASSVHGEFLDDVNPGLLIYDCIYACSEVSTELTGAPGESIYGNAIPGRGRQGGGAYPGTPGSSNGGQVIEYGNVVDSGPNTPGAGGISRSGTAEGGNGRP